MVQPTPATPIKVNKGRPEQHPIQIQAMAEQEEGGSQGRGGPLPDTLEFEANRRPSVNGGSSKGQ